MKLDLFGIFFSPPKSVYERVVLFIMLSVSFCIFFTPFRFSEINPVQAGLYALFPSLSISWGWIVAMRYMFRRGEFLI